MFRSMIKCLKSDKIKIYTLLIIFSVFVINIVSTLTNFIENDLDKQIINKEENRIIYASSNNNVDRFDEILSSPYVTNVYYNIDPILANCNEKDYYIKHFNPTVKLKRVAGNINEIKENEVIVPKSFIRYDEMKLNDNLGKNVVIKFDDMNFYFRISGIYDDNNQNQYIYISSKSKINKLIDNKTNYIVLVNQQKNISKVSEILSNMNCYNQYNIDISAERELLIYKDINKVFIGFSKVCYLFLVIIIFILIILNISEKKYNIALMKTVGYSNKFIANVIFLIFSIIFIFSLLISIIVINGIDLFLEKWLNLNEFYNLNIIMKNGSIIFVELFISIIIIIFQVKRINIIKLLKN